MSFKQIKRILPILCGCMMFAVLLYASGGEGAHEGGHHGVQWMDLVKRTINFAALVFFLWYLLADKIKKYFSERRIEIGNLLEEVDKEKNDAEQKFILYEQKFKEIEKDINEITKTLIGEIENEKNKIIEEGKANSQRLIEQAKAAAEQEVINSRQNLRNYVVELAGSMAVSIVSKEMTDKDQERLVEEYINDVAREN
ncbi:MAG TPA: ATP synthase F0 subunit B [Desulfomonilia bacterium]